MGRALAEARDAFPGLRRLLDEENGRRRRHVNVFYNGVEEDAIDDPARPAADRDEILIIQAVSGGAAGFPDLINRPSDPAAVERLRQLCLALPGVTEKLSHGEAAWFVAGKQFLTTADHHHDDRFGIWCAAPEGAQQLLIEADPERFFRPPYVGHRGWIGVYLDAGEPDWNELSAIIERAYRRVAPERLLRQLSGEAD